MRESALGIYVSLRDHVIVFPGELVRARFGLQLGLRVLKFIVGKVVQDVDRPTEPFFDKASALFNAAKQVLIQNPHQSLLLLTVVQITLERRLTKFGQQVV